MTTSALGITTKGKVGRASRTPGQLWQVPVFLAGVLALVAVAVAAPFRQDPIRAQFNRDLAAVRRALDEGTDNFGELLMLTENVVVQAARFPERYGETHFLAGSVFQKLADASPAEQTADYRKKALERLEEALAHGVPPDDSARLNYRLAVAILQQSEDLRRAIDLLSQSVEQGADRPGHGYGLLVQALLSLAVPDLEAALQANQRQLEYLDNDDELAQARLVRGEILLKKERRQEALRNLELIGPKAARDLRVRARLLQARCCEEDGLWNQAALLWKELLLDATEVPGGKARVLYSLGLSRLNSEPPDEMGAISAWEEVLRVGGEEGQAAALKLAQFDLFSTPVQTTRAFANLSLALSEVNSPKEYANRLVDLPKVRALFEEACRSLRETGEYAEVQKFAELYKKVAAPGGAELLIAQALEALAHEFKEKAGPGASLDPNKLKEVRQQFQKAGAAYEQAAHALAQPQRSPALWRSAACYLLAKDYHKAQAILEMFLQTETADARLAEGWLALAEAYQAQGHKDKALQAYYQCIAFPGTPFRARARYQLALGEIDRNNLKEAEEILKQNLQTTSPIGDREAHEKSVFKLASLLLKKQDYEKAVFYLKVAVSEFPNNPSILFARDDLGDCYRKLAAAAFKKFQAERARENEAHYRRSWQMWLEQASFTYQKLADDLEGRAAKTTLSAGEDALFRKVEFDVADLRLELNDIPEALRRYQNLLKRYRGQYAGLVSCERIFLCLGPANQTPELFRKVQEAARLAVADALSDLQAMQRNEDGTKEKFRGPDGRSLEDWRSRLMWISAEVNRSPGSAMDRRPNPPLQ
jgi:tetratricopeptide (TPR) repeat protein